MNAVVDVGVDLAAATALAMILVAAFKGARPASSTMAIILSAMLSGIGSAFLIGTAHSMSWAAATIAGTTIVGLMAGGAAAGIRATDNAADAKRTG